MVVHKNGELTKCHHRNWFTLSRAELVFFLMALRETHIESFEEDMLVFFLMAFKKNMLVC
jgi:hypothetical protein